MFLQPQGANAEGSRQKHFYLVEKVKQKTLAFETQEEARKLIELT